MNQLRTKAGVSSHRLPPPYSGQILVKKSCVCAANRPVAWIRAVFGPLMTAVMASMAKGSHFAENVTMKKVIILLGFCNEYVRARASVKAGSRKTPLR